MARNKSELLSAMGSGFEILKAITDAVIERGGTDDNVRRVLKDKHVKNAIAKILVDDQKFFTFIVDFDDPKWKEFPFNGNYAGLNVNLKAEHFPVRYSGKAEVTVELVRHDEGYSFEQHFAAIKKENAFKIDRAISETFHALFPDERKKGRIVSPCGNKLEIDGNQNLAYVLATHNGVSLYFFYIDLRWHESHQFLVLRSIKPLAA